MVLKVNGAIQIQYKAIEIESSHFHGGHLGFVPKNNFACLDFSRLLVCYSRDLSDHKTIEKPSVAICGGFSYIMP